MAGGGLGQTGDQFHTVNFRKSTGESVTVDGTSSLAVFVAPVACKIVDIGMTVTVAITADGSDFWTITITNQTGGVSLLSASFDTDSGNSGNGGRGLTADALTSLTDDGSGNSYLQNEVLAKGDILIITATKDSSADDLKNPTITVHYRTD